MICLLLIQQANAFLQTVESDASVGVCICDTKYKYKVLAGY